jgi:hypothetical protein
MTHPGRHVVLDVLAGATEQLLSVWHNLSNLPITFQSVVSGARRKETQNPGFLRRKPGLTVVLDIPAKPSDWIQNPVLARG